MCSTSYVRILGTFLGSFLGRIDAAQTRGDGYAPRRSHRAAVCRAQFRLHPVVSRAAYNSHSTYTPRTLVWVLLWSFLSLGLPTCYLLSILPVLEYYWMIIDSIVAPMNNVYKSDHRTPFSLFILSLPKCHHCNHCSTFCITVH